MPFVHMRKADPVTEASKTSLQTHSETETVLSHFEKLCQSLLVVACSEKSQ